MKCLLCGEGPLPAFGHVRDYFVTGDEFELVRCAPCDMTYTNFAMDDEAFSRYYGSSQYYAHSKGFAQLGLRERVQRDAIRLRSGQSIGVVAWLRTRILSSLVLVDLPGASGMKVLDVGCGAGRLLLAAKEAACECHGAEPSSQAREVLGRLGIAAYPSIFDESIPSGYFDVVTFNQSLEHMPNPVTALARAKQLLAPGGRIVVSVPNFASAERVSFGLYWRHIDPPRHLHHFSPGALAKLGDLTKLRLVSRRFKVWGWPRDTFALARQQAGARAVVMSGAFAVRQFAALLRMDLERAGSMMSYTFEV